MTKNKLSYDDITAQKMKSLADGAMSSTQEKIEQLSSMSSNSHISSFNNLMSWQTWIATISFTLSAIGGTVLIDVKETLNVFVLVSLLIFLITGLWIMLFQKRIYESASINSSKEVDLFMPLYDNRKRAAWRFYQEPHSIERHINFLKCELAIMRETSRQEAEQLAVIRGEKTDYRNDIWLAMLVSAVYFMLQPTGQKLYSQLNLVAFSFNYVFWIAWLVFILIILNSALGSDKNVKAGAQSKELKLKAEMRQSKAYTATIRKELNSLKDLRR